MTKCFFLNDSFNNHLRREPHSLFNVLDFKMWPDKNTQTEEFRQYGDEEIEKLVALYESFLREEEREMLKTSGLV